MRNRNTLTRALGAAVSERQPCANASVSSVASWSAGAALMSKGNHTP